MSTLEKQSGQLSTLKLFNFVIKVSFSKDLFLLETNQQMPSLTLKGFLGARSSSAFKKTCLAFHEVRFKVHEKFASKSLLLSLAFASRPNGMKTFFYNYIFDYS